MEKYKICPSCGAKNDPALLECTECEADLTRAKVTDEESEKVTSDSREGESEAASARMVRICDCGAKNPPNARKCSECREDISDIPPTPDTEEVKTEEKFEFVLSSIDGKYAFRISGGGLTVGREKAMSEYLSDKIYVSREHAEFTAEENSLYIENLSHTNFTYVNNVKITDKTKLSDGDEIGLGGTSINGSRQEHAAYFLVRICPCT